MLYWAWIVRDQPESLPSSPAETPVPSDRTCPLVELGTRVAQGLHHGGLSLFIESKLAKATCNKDWASVFLLLLVRSLALCWSSWLQAEGLSVASLEEESLHVPCRSSRCMGVRAVPSRSAPSARLMMLVQW